MLNIPIETLPTATRCVIANSLPSDEQGVRNVFLIRCLRTQSKGTGFLLSNGTVITNDHVVQGSLDSEILAISSTGSSHKIKKSIRDKKKIWQF